MTRQTLLVVLVGAVLVGGIWGGQALVAAESKDGTVKSVDATAKTFVLDREPRALTITVNEKTVITLDGKASTFGAAIKVDAKVSVTYAKSGEDRVASKVEVTAGEKKGETKTGTVKSVDAKAKTFVLERDPRPMTIKVNEKTAITLDGKDSTFEAAIKVDAKVSVTYTRSGEDRIASKIEVTTGEKK